jgi:thymidylate kinase
MLARGFTVAILGPDGAGKTTLAYNLKATIPRPVKTLYMGGNAYASNHLLPTTRALGAIRRAVYAKRAARRVQSTQPARRSSGLRESLLRPAHESLRLFERLSEESYRQALAWFYRQRGAIVLLDRDFFFDYHAYAVRADEGAIVGAIHERFLSRLYRRPDLVIYLDAPAEILFERKGEASVERLSVIRERYLAMAFGRPEFHVVDAAGPAALVLAEASELIEAFAARRPEAAR